MVRVTAHMNTDADSQTGDRVRSTAATESLSGSELRSSCAGSIGKRLTTIASFFCMVIPEGKKKRVARLANQDVDGPTREDKNDTSS